MPKYHSDGWYWLILVDWCICYLKHIWNKSEDRQLLKNVKWRLTIAKTHDKKTKLNTGVDSYFFLVIFPTSRRKCVWENIAPRLGSRKLTGNSKPKTKDQQQSRPRQRWGVLKISTYSKCIFWTSLYIQRKFTTNNNNSILSKGHWNPCKAV